MQSQCKRYEMYIPKYPMQPYMALRKELGDVFGAFTELPMSVGYWVSPEDAHVCEEGVAVIVLVLVSSRESELMEMLSKYKLDAKQQAVMVVSTDVHAVLI